MPPTLCKACAVGPVNEPLRELAVATATTCGKADATPGAHEPIGQDRASKAIWHVGCYCVVTDNDISCYHR